ncbi:S8 family serine peptidase [Maridesulfovibrio sp.]|uniref:S8 family serine peptidase n=1 Tax=Maridesulfovibrio sp. TaxID=2795000 RepID=UPI0029CAA725|nr:S8 family serine peptidase [Maridesulfovibrio sp.]
MQLFFFLIVILTILPVSLTTPSAASQTSEPSAQLYFHDRQVDPLKEELVLKLLPESDEGSDISSDSSASTMSFARTLTRLFSFSLQTEVEEYDYYVVQFNGPVQEEWKNSLTELGAVFYDYIPQYAFIVKLGTSKVDSVERLGSVRWIGEYDPDLKLSGRVFDIAPYDLEKDEGQVKLRVLAFPDEDSASLLGSIRSAGGTVDSVNSSAWGISVGVSISVEKIEKLKDIKGVKWIEKAPEHRAENNISTGIIEARFEQEKTWPVSGSKLFGKGQLVAICDSGIDTGDPASINDDFSDGQGNSRVSNTVFDKASKKDYSGHGTHVAGIVAGNGLASGSSPQSEFFPSTCYAGIAPEAELYFQSVGAEDGSSQLPGIPSDLSQLFQPAYDAGARIHSNSWGTAGAGEYDSESVSVDRFMWDNKDFLVLYAVGNAGYDKDMDGVIDPYCIDSPATAKNCLSVGASESYRKGAGEGFFSVGYGKFRTYAEPIGSDLFSDKPYGLAAFSSRGPTLDGRYKPEVVAPGTNILSTRSSAQLGNGWGAFNNSYYWSGGTSMATPLVAGMAAVMREYLMEEEGLTDPSAALLKTSIIHGTVSLAPGQYGTGPYKEIAGSPDFAQGWGRIDLEASINSDESSEIEYHDIKSSAPADSSYVRTFTFDVNDDSKPFKATLGWTDYPGSTVAYGGLVNDLDLRVRKPDGTWVYPDNAVGLSSLTGYVYVSSVSGFYGAEVCGLLFTPPCYPSTLESVALSFQNENSIASKVDIVVYSYDGAVGDELFRKSFAYIPSGKYALPVGLTVSSGNIVVAVEKTNSSLGVYCNGENPTARGLFKTGGVWQEASFTPAIIANFRTVSASTSSDRINNTESVTIDNPVPGTYKVEVSAYNIPMGPQPYALVMSGMVGDKPSDGDIEINEEQPDAPVSTFLNKSSTSCSAESVNAGYGTSMETVYSAESAFSVQTAESGTVSIKYAVSGLPAIKARDLELAKLFSNGTNKPFSYASYEDYTDGNWWLSDVSGNFIDPVNILNADKSYYVVSVIKDGGDYDANAEAGVIDDPQVLGIASSSTGAAGCTVGTANDFGMVGLLLFALFSMLPRCFAEYLSRRALRSRK